MNEALLDYVARKCKLYVSNLRLPTSSEAILSIVKELDCNLFSADDWSKSLSYIFKKPLYFSTSVSAKKYYIKKLRISLSDEDDESNMTTIF